MLLDELSSKFDIYFNNITSNQAPGLSEYEKSIFLTQGQENVIVSLYNGGATAGFEETEELRRYLANLIVEAEREPITNTNDLPLGIDTLGNDSKHRYFTLPEGVWFITYEGAKVSYGEEQRCGKSEGYVQVVPARQDEYHILRHNPFRGLNDRRALRFDLADGVVEIVCKYEVTSYYLRYLKKPYPIILEDLQDGLSINGKTEKRELEVSEFLHQRILETAVELAARSWKGVA